MSLNFESVKERGRLHDTFVGDLFLFGVVGKFRNHCDFIKIYSGEKYNEWRRIKSFPMHSGFSLIKAKVEI